MQTRVETRTPTQWWTPVEMPGESVVRYEVGPLLLHIQCSDGEWRLAWSHAAESADHTRWSATECAPDTLPETHERYMFSTAQRTVALRPRLADRAVVIRPRSPVFLPSGEQTTLFLSSPLTVEIRIGDTQALREVPMVALSDTWFGPSTREGELCYSARTHARHSIEEVPLRPHRAITALNVHNLAASVLPLEKLSLPVPVLSVYGAADGSLWTESVTLTREKDGDMAAIRVDRGPPDGPAAPVLLSGPRQEGGRSGLVRAFSVLFGN